MAYILCKDGDYIHFRDQNDTNGHYKLQVRDYHGQDNVGWVLEQVDAQYFVKLDPNLESYYTAKAKLAVGLYNYMWACAFRNHEIEAYDFFETEPHTMVAQPGKDRITCLALASTFFPNGACTCWAVYKDKYGAEVGKPITQFYGSAGVAGYGSCEIDDYYAESPNSPAEVKIRFRYIIEPDAPIDGQWGSHYTSCYMFAFVGSIKNMELYRMSQTLPPSDKTRFVIGIFQMRGIDDGDTHIYPESRSISTELIDNSPFHNMNAGWSSIGSSYFTFMACGSLWPGKTTPLVVTGIHNVTDLRYDYLVCEVSNIRQDYE